MPTVSVIVPVYNAVSYLPRCVKSLVGQTLGDIEIILVDDGSTDGSAGLCDTFAKTDDRVHVLHLASNRMQGEARNAGLDIARGDFIGFVDADDFIEPDTYEAAWNAIRKYDADISMFGIRVLDTDGSVHFTGGLGKVSVWNREQALRSFFNDENIVTDTCVNKLYARRLFDTLRFQPGIIFEDNELTGRLLEKVRKSIHIGEWKYSYNKHTGSTTRQAFRKENLCIVPIHQERIARVRRQDSALLQAAEGQYVRCLINTLNLLLQSGYRQNTESARLLLKEIRQYASQALGCLRPTKAVETLLLCFCFPLYRVLQYAVRKKSV